MREAISSRRLARWTIGLALLWGGAAPALDLLPASAVAPGRTAGAGFVQVDSSLSPWGGLGEGAEVELRAGFPGQLYDVVAVEVASPTGGVAEGSAAAFDVVGQCDDGSRLVPAAESWDIVAGPIATLDGGGQAMLAAVYRVETGVVQATAFGFTGQGAVRVLDSDPDNYGLYAHDNIQDLWQIGYFGPSSTNGLAGADPDGDRDDNYYEFIAGTDPLLPGSAFRVTVSRSGGLRVAGAPAGTNRTYRLQQAASLRPGVWTDVGEGTGFLSNGQWVVTGLSGTNALQNYRMAVEYSWR